MRAVSIIIPTRGRPDYLAVTLDTVAPQSRAAGAEIVVVDDGESPGAVASIAHAFGARVIRTGGAGANAARNAGIAATVGDPVVLLDDDVAVPSGWLTALLDGVRRNEDHEVFGGPIHARLEGHRWRSCAGDPAPITTLDLGGADRDAEMVWSANMAIRRAALMRVGPFDESIHGRGEEEDWLRRFAAQGGRVRYLAGAGLIHRRSRADARLDRLARAAYALGRTARRNDLRKACAPPLAAELRTLAGCLWHIVRRRCAIGVVMAAHSAGRVREALR